MTSISTKQDHTDYYPLDGWKVAASSAQSELIYTGNFWYWDTSGAMVYDLTQSPVGLTWGTIDVPSGYDLIQMNQMIEPAFWVGMGPKQLTGDTMMGFFGWYYNHLAPGSPVTSANYKDFVEEYLGNGDRRRSHRT